MTTSIANSDNEEFMTDLRRQAVLNRVRDVTEGRLLTSDNFLKKLKLTVEKLDSAVQSYRMFSLTMPDGSSVFPAFYATGNELRSCIELISKTLGNMPGESKWEFFTSPRLSLAGKTPVEALAAGKRTEVVAAAVAFKQ